MITKYIITALVTYTFVEAFNSKVETSLIKSLESNAATNIFVKFQNGNSIPIQRTLQQRFTTRHQKVNALVNNLKSYTESSQINTVNLLQSLHLTYEQVWISNELLIKEAKADLVKSLAEFSEVVAIRAERVLALPPIFVESETITPNADWNIDIIEAPAAWELPGGNSGQGIVVANLDGGVRYTHDAIRNNFRQPYGWFDPDNFTTFPSDDTGHGTHTIGSAIGSNGIGVAPGAQWISCKACKPEGCYERELKACAQWIMCPTTPNGTNADCSKAAHISSNSWGGWGPDDMFNDALAAWQAANIIPVFSIGNAGPYCEKTSYPGYELNVIGVGATKDGDIISLMSSPGPGPDGSIKPDVVAPGQNVRSAWHSADNVYIKTTGTSMSAPHVAGAAALLLSGDPNLTFAQVKETLEKTADTKMGDSGTGLACGGINMTVFPNNHYGYGRINVKRALEAVLNNRKV